MRIYLFPSSDYLRICGHYTALKGYQHNTGTMLQLTHKHGQPVFDFRNRQISSSLSCQIQASEPTNLIFNNDQ